MSTRAGPVELWENIYVKGAEDLEIDLETDDTRFVVGDGTKSADLRWYFGIATAFLDIDASANALTLNGPNRVTGLGLPTRFELTHDIGRGKPALNAVIALDENSNAAAHLAANIADRHFEILGTNMTTALVTYYAEGGLLFTTAGASGDQAILAPHLDAGQTAWTSVTWGTDREVHWETLIQTAASVATSIFWAGLKLTNTSVVATDADQAFFRAATDANWYAVYSIGGTDTETDTGVALAAATKYHLKIVISAARLASFYINGALVATSTALTDAIDLIPYVGVQASAAAASSVRYHGQKISRAIG